MDKMDPNSPDHTFRTNGDQSTEPNIKREEGGGTSNLDRGGASESNRPTKREEDLEIKQEVEENQNNPLQAESKSGDKDVQIKAEDVFSADDDKMEEIGPKDNDDDEEKHQTDSERNLRLNDISREEHMMQNLLEQEEKSKKTDQILSACNDRDKEQIVGLAKSEHGLISDDVRRTAWPILLGYEPFSTPPPISHNNSEKPVSWESLPKHRDEEQVQLDVTRSFVYYPQDPSQEELESRRKELSNLILETLRRHPMLCYFQGFHDICQVILLVLGPIHSVRAVEYISLQRIRDFMLPSIEPSLQHLQLLHPILYTIDEKLCRHLSTTQPFFALSAMLTLYAHDIQAFSDISRLMDVFLACPPAFPVYFFVAIILSRRTELFAIPEDEPDMLHFTLSKLPKPLNLENLITSSQDLYRQHPPEKLSAWYYVSNNSVLKTYINTADSSRPTKNEGEENDEKLSANERDREEKELKEAEVYFAKQVAELSRAEFKKKIWKSVNGLATHKSSMMYWTVAAGVSAVALGVYFNKRGGGGSSFQGSVGNLEMAAEKLWEAVVHLNAGH